MDKVEKNFYDILRVSKDATKSDIRKAYFKLARVKHPDKVSQSKAAQKDATIIFQEIVNAYEVLTDPDRRTAYDNMLSGGRSSSCHGGGGESSSCYGGGGESSSCYGGGGGSSSYRDGSGGSSSYRDGSGGSSSYRDGSGGSSSYRDGSGGSSSYRDGSGGSSSCYGGGGGSSSYRGRRTPHWQYNQYGKSHFDETQTLASAQASLAQLLRSNGGSMGGNVLPKMYKKKYGFNLYYFGYKNLTKLMETVPGVVVHPNPTGKGFNSFTLSERSVPLRVQNLIRCVLSKQPDKKISGSGFVHAWDNECPKYPCFSYYWKKFGFSSQTKCIKAVSGVEILPGTPEYYLLRR